MSDEWGYVEKMPIHVGGGIPLGAFNERAYLNQLRGPKGERVSYVRLGSMFANGNPIDIYEVRHDGLAAPVHLYFDMYTSPSANLKAPKGFTLAF